jgi:RimJ/RimL family protein N-acetyltransferase
MLKQHIEPIIGKKIKLRLLKRSDLMTTLHWRNQDHIRKWFVFSDLITKNNHFRWFELYQKKDNDFVFIIEEIQKLKRPIGQVSLYNVNWKEKTAEFGRLMIGDKEANGIGLGKEASLLAVKVAKMRLGIKMLYLETFSDNIAAMKIYLDIGFSVVRKTPEMIHMELNL